jgi:hypothetical protein
MTKTKDRIAELIEESKRREAKTPFQQRLEGLSREERLAICIPIARAARLRIASLNARPAPDEDDDQPPRRSTG